MKKWKHPLLWGLVTLLIGTPLFAAEISVPDGLRFAIADEHSMTPAEKTAWHRRLRETPGITIPLMELFWRCFEAPRDLTGSVVKALMERNDIPPLELEKLSKTLRRLAESGPVSQLDADKRNLFFTMCLLRRAPTAENEDLALLLLECDDSYVRSIAATTLGWIGSKRSTRIMQ